jgi:hypothetical protein
MKIDYRLTAILLMIMLLMIGMMIVAGIGTKTLAPVEYLGLQLGIG